MNKEQLKKMVEKCVYSKDGITYMSDKQYNNYIKENKQLKDNWNKLKEWLNAFHKLSEFEQWEIVKKMQELERGDNNDTIR